MGLEGGFAVLSGEVGHRAVRGPEVEDTPGVFLRAEGRDELSESLRAVGSYGLNAVRGVFTRADSHLTGAAVTGDFVRNGSGEVHIAAGEDEPVPFHVMLFRRGDLAPDDVVTDIGALLSGPDLVQRVPVGAAHGQVDDVADRRAVRSVDAEARLEHFLFEGIAFLHDSAAPDRVRSFAVKVDALNAEGHESLAVGIAVIGAHGGDHALQAAVEHGGMDNKTAAPARFLGVQAYLGYGAVISAPEMAQAAEDGAVMNGSVGIELRIEGVDINLPAAPGEILQINVRARGALQGSNLAGHVHMPAALRVSRVSAVDFEIRAAVRRIHENLNPAGAVIEHEGFAENHVFEAHFIAAKVIHAGCGGEIKMRGAGDDDIFEYLVLREEGLAFAAHERGVLGRRERGGKAASEQDMSRVRAGRFSFGGFGSGNHFRAEGFASLTGAAGDDDVLIKGLILRIGVARGPVKAGFREQIMPAFRGKEGIDAAEILIVYLAEEASERDFEAKGGTRKGDFTEKKQAARGEQRADVLHGLGDIGGRVQDVGAYDNIEFSFPESLLQGIAAHVQGAVFDEGESGETLLPFCRENGGNIRVDVARALGRKDGQEGGGGAARARADFKDGNLPVKGKGVHYGLQGFRHDAVVVAALGGVLINLFNGVGAASGKHHFPRVLRSSEDAAEALPAVLHKRKQWQVGRDEILIVCCF